MTHEITLIRCAHELEIEHILRHLDVASALWSSCLVQTLTNTYQAYISISLDATGLFRFLAFWVASKGGSSGRKLFTYLYIFFLVSGVVVGNVSIFSETASSG